MPGAILTIKPHLVWDGEVLNYIPWKKLIQNEIQDLSCEFSSEEEEMFFVASHIENKQMIAFIKDCSSIEEIFLCLDAQNSTIYDMKDEFHRRIKLVWSRVNCFSK